MYAVECSADLAPLDVVASHDLGRSLLAWRILREIKQSHAAELCGVSQGTISRWEQGRQQPSTAQARRLVVLLSARPDGASDRALLDLVRRSSAKVHLVCDLTHRLLACSPAREHEWRVSAHELAGRSLWRYASAEIGQAERKLGDLGWFEAVPPSLIVSTGSNGRDDVPIRPSRARWVRFRLADGSFARLVETT